MTSADGPPTSLKCLAVAVQDRLGRAGVKHRVRFIEPSDVSSWSIAVDVEDGSVDLILGNHHADTIGVILDYEEDVSVALATEFVAMSVDLITEQEWRDLLHQEQEIRRLARRERRLGRWRRLLGR